MFNRSETTRNKNQTKNNKKKKKQKIVFSTSIYIFKKFLFSILLIF